VTIPKIGIVTAGSVAHQHHYDRAAGIVVMQTIIIMRLVVVVVDAMCQDPPPLLRLLPSRLPLIVVPAVRRTTATHAATPRIAATIVRMMTAESIVIEIVIRSAVNTVMSALQKRFIVSISRRAGPLLRVRVRLD
jgi:hypothetical protein